MSENKVPEPTVMPVDRHQWVKQIGLSNFINAYYQFRDIQNIGGCNKILIVGPGQGFEKVVFKWRGYVVATLDIDRTFAPDYVGSVHDLSMFVSKQFDAVIASHVIEHLPVPYLDASLKEIARVGTYALIYLPVCGKHLQGRFITGARRIDLSLIFDLCNYFKKPDGTSPCYMGEQHFWEVGMRGFRIRDLKKRFSEFFQILDVYRNKDWIPSMNFVLRSRDMVA